MRKPLFGKYDEADPPSFTGNVVVLKAEAIAREDIDPCDIVPASELLERSEEAQFPVLRERPFLVYLPVVRRVEDWRRLHSTMDVVNSCGTRALVSDAPHACVDSAPWREVALDSRWLVSLDRVAVLPRRFNRNEDREEVRRCTFACF